MTSIEIILEAICEKSGKGREEVKKLIEEKQLKFRKQISELAAATIVARELGAEIAGNRKTTTKIADLHHLPPGTSNISIMGRVERNYSPFEFKKDQGSGTIHHFKVSDNSGIISVIVWGNLVEFIKKIGLERGTVIRINNGMLKAGQSGERELHLNEKSEILKNPPGGSAEEFQPVFPILSPDTITSIEPSPGEVDISGRISKMGNLREFDKGNGTSGKYINVELSGKLKCVRIVAWGEKAEEFVSLSENDEILIEGATLKPSRTEQNEVHLNRKSRVTILNQAPPSPIEGSTSLGDQLSKVGPNKASFDLKVVLAGKIADLKAGSSLSMTLRVEFANSLIEFTRPDGRKGYCKRLCVFDETGSNFLVLWDKDAQNTLDFQSGQCISLSSAFLKPNNRGVPEIYLNRGGKVEKTQNFVIIPDRIPFVPINSILPNWRIASIRGQIVEVGKVREFVRESDQQRGQVCWARMVDMTGEMRVVGWNSQASLVEGLKVGSNYQLTDIGVRIQDSGHELHLTSFTGIEIIPESEVLWKNSFHGGPIPYYPVQGLSNTKFSRISISDMQEAESHVELKARVTQLGSKDPIYFSCPICFQKISNDYTETAECANHGSQRTEVRFRIPVVLDDGSGIFFATLFGPIAERMAQIPSSDLQSPSLEIESLRERISEKIVGREYLFLGVLSDRSIKDDRETRVNKNLSIKSVFLPNGTFEIKKHYQTQMLTTEIEGPA